MFNQRNYGIAQGQIVSKPYIKEVRGGNKSAFFAIKCPDNYESRDEHGCYVRRFQHLEFQCFVPERNKELLATLETLERNDEVIVRYSVRTNHYIGKDGKEVRRQDLNVEDITINSKYKFTETE